MKTDRLLLGCKAIFDNVHRCRFYGFVAGGESGGIYLCYCGKRWHTCEREE